MRKIYLISIISFLIIGIFFYFSKKNILPSRNTLTLFQSDFEDHSKLLMPTIIAQNLEIPWAIAFLPDNRLLVTERKGAVKIIDSNSETEPVLAATIADNEAIGEGGLLGIVLHPQFDQNNFVYLYHTYIGDNKILNKVIRMKFENDKLANEEVIIDKIPGASTHNGGRIKFGIDGYLYVTTGDAQETLLAQNTQSLAGKILRITDEGQAAPDNPFNNLIYSYGHRNPQGITWDSEGQLWATEHGSSARDEVNLIENGKNYGWPLIQGDETSSGMVAPKLNSGTASTWAPSGATFIGNSLFFVGLRGETLYEAIIQNNKVIELKEHLLNEYGRLREVITGPDGRLYITTNNRDGRGNPRNLDDKIIKIDPQKLSN